MAKIDDDIKFLKEMKQLSNSLLKDAYDITKVQHLDQMIGDWLDELCEGQKVETSESNCIKTTVSNQRELLLAFADAIINVHGGDKDKIGKVVDLYLKSNLSLLTLSIGDVADLNDKIMNIQQIMNKWEEELLETQEMIVKTSKNGNVHANDLWRHVAVIIRKHMRDLEKLNEDTVSEGEFCFRCGKRKRFKGDGTITELCEC